MKPYNLYSLLAVVAPCLVKVSDVKHLVVLAYIQNSMTTFVLGSSEGCGSSPLRTRVSAAGRHSYGGECLNPSTSSKKGGPNERETRERRRLEKTNPISETNEPMNVL